MVKKRYIYTGTIQLSQYAASDILDLIVTANELCLPTLISCVQDHLIKNESTWLHQNLVKTLHIAFQSNNDDDDYYNYSHHNDFQNSSFSQNDSTIIQNPFQKLWDYILKIICNSPKILFESNDFVNLKESVLIYLLKLNSLEIEEIKIWEYLIKWGIANTRSKKDNSNIPSSPNSPLTILTIPNSPHSPLAIPNSPHSLLTIPNSPRSPAFFNSYHYPNPNPNPNPNFNSDNPSNSSSSNNYLIHSNNSTHSNNLSYSFTSFIEKDIKQYSDQDFSDLKSTLEKCIPLIRFYQISAKDFYKKVRSPFKKILPEDLNENILRYHMDPESIGTSVMLPRGIRCEYIDSVIINGCHTTILSNWIDKRDKKNEKNCYDNNCNDYNNYDFKRINPYKFNLLLRGSKDGFSVKDFHKHCDGKSNLLVVVKVQDSDQIVGGFNPLQWESLIESNNNNSRSTGNSGNKRKGNYHRVDCYDDEDSDNDDGDDNKDELDQFSINEGSSPSSISVCSQSSSIINQSNQLNQLRQLNQFDQFNQQEFDDNNDNNDISNNNNDSSDRKNNKDNKSNNNNCYQTNINIQNFRETPDSFLFTFNFIPHPVNSSKLSRIEPCYASRAIYLSNYYGPCFGESDLHMLNNERNWKCDISSYKERIFDNSGEFWAEDYEVFQVVCKEYEDNS